MFSLLTINAAIQDVRLFSRSVYRPVNHALERLHGLARQISKLDPDIICVQELFHNDFQHRFHALLSGQYPFAAGLAGTGIKFRLDNELLVFAKFPLSGGGLTRFRHVPMEERLFTSKGFYGVDVSVPGTGCLRLVNFHMTAGGIRHHPESPRMEHIRARQIRQVLDSLDREDLPVLLAGDLNAGKETSRMNYDAIIKAGFVDAFEVCGGRGVSWDPGNPMVENHAESHLPPQRIDHVFVDGASAHLLLPDQGRIVLQDACVPLPFGRNIPVSDHYGVLVHFKCR